MKYYYHFVYKNNTTNMATTNSVSPSSNAFSVVHLRKNNTSTNNNNNSNTIGNDLNNQLEHNETYYYFGEHWEGCDYEAPYIIYHYISKTHLNGRNINTVDIYDYDLEIWPCDRLWREASTKKDIIIDIEDV